MQCQIQTLRYRGGGGGGAPLDSPRQKLGFSSRIGYYIHWNLSSGMKIRVSKFFSIPTIGGKIVETLSFNGVHVTLENKKIPSPSPHPFQVWVFVVVVR